MCSSTEMREVGESLYKLVLVLNMGEPDLLPITENNQVVLVTGKEKEGKKNKSDSLSLPKCMLLIASEFRMDFCRLFICPIMAVPWNTSQFN